MCKGFGLIVGRELETYFCEPEISGNCSHTETLKRLGWKENEDVYLRSFVRVQFFDWTSGSFEFDEEKTLPGWAEEHRQEIQDRCTRILELCTPAWAEYVKVRDVAWAEYVKMSDVAWAEYVKVRDAAHEILIEAWKTIPGYVPKKGE
jgi:hypothetical protein